METGGATVMCSFDPARELILENRAPGEKRDDRARGIVAVFGFEWGLQGAKIVGVHFSALVGYDIQALISF